MWSTVEVDESEGYLYSLTVPLVEDYQIQDIVAGSLLASYHRTGSWALLLPRRNRAANPGSPIRFNPPRVIAQTPPRLTLYSAHEIDVL